MPILALDDILPNTVASQDVFESNTAKIPLLRKGTIITAEYLHGLRRRGINGLYVTEAIYTDDDGFLIATPQKKRDTSMAGMPFEKSRPAIVPKLRKEIIKALRDLHLCVSGQDDVGVKKAIDRIGDYIADVVDHMANATNETYNITSLQSDQEFVYHHSLSVAVISLAMGQAMGLSTYELMQLGRCAALHDIGKFMLPQEIFYKRESLDQDEMETMRKHSEMAYDALKTWDECTENERKAILCHHERLNGTGYPEGLEGEIIPKWAKIIAVADVFDAMTSLRPHRPAVTPSEACEYLTAMAHQNFETEMIRALTKKIEFYPVGSFVQLSTNETGVVINSKKGLRPTIKTLATNNLMDLSDQRHLATTIVRTVSYREALAHKK